MRLLIQTIDHKDQRYPTTGDWQLINQPGVEGLLLVSVSKMGDWRYEMLVGLHEAVEALLCKERGVKDEDVCAFDREFEAAREAAGDASEFMFRGSRFPIDYEPGDCEDAPYQNEHNVATAVERTVCAALGVSWRAYEDANLALYD